MAELELLTFKLSKNDNRSRKLEYTTKTAITLLIADVISRLRNIPRFNLSTYRIGDFETETERENDEQGDYIDAYEIESLIRELTNDL